MMRRGVGRGRRSLVGTAARTAVIAGTATAVAGKVSAGQQQKAQAAAADQQQAAADDQAASDSAVAEQVAAQAPPAAAGDDVIEQIKALAGLRDAGVLTEEEFSAKKAQLLGI